MASVVPVAILSSCHCYHISSRISHQKNATATVVSRSGTRELTTRKLLKHNWLQKSRELVLKSQPSRTVKCELAKATTYSSKVSIDASLYESPQASFDQYLEDKPRVFKAIFPDDRNSQQLNDDEWRVHMTPVQFFFLSCNPVIDMRMRCKTQGKDYPDGVPSQVTKVLDLDIVLLHTVRWELHGLQDILKPSHFSLGIKGALYPHRQGNQSRLKGQLTMSMTFAVPPVLALIPEDVRRDVAETVLKSLVEDMEQQVNGSLLADYSKFKKERAMKFA